MKINYKLSMKDEYWILFEHYNHKEAKLKKLLSFLLKLIILGMMFIVIIAAENLIAKVCAIAYIIILLIFPNFVRRKLLHDTLFFGIDKTILDRSLEVKNNILVLSSDIKKVNVDLSSIKKVFQYKDNIFILCNDVTLSDNDKNGNIRNTIVIPSTAFSNEVEREELLTIIEKR